MKAKKSQPKLEHASGNTLSEIFSFLSEIEQAKHDYRHIEEYLPKSLIREIDKLHKAASKEHTKRENEM